MARRKARRKTSCGCTGNIPMSKYHHKRGGVGRGHHKMSDLGATRGNCWITDTSRGPRKLCRKANGQVRFAKMR